MVDRRVVTRLQEIQDRGYITPYASIIQFCKANPSLCARVPPGLLSIPHATVFIYLSLLSVHSLTYRPKVYRRE
jgi:hypothetical protein